MNLKKNRKNYERYYTRSGSSKNLFYWATFGSSSLIFRTNFQEEEWKIKSRTRTVLGILCACLNFGTDPPGIVKPDPCADLECWVEPKKYPKKVALNMVGKNLEKQFTKCDPRSKFKKCLDPPIKKLKLVCKSGRKYALSERILFYYNGHGVPKPTKNGEIWVFNQQFTQYIPVTIQELKSWLGSPSIFVFDCNEAGILAPKFEKKKQKNKLSQQFTGASTTSTSVTSATSNTSNDSSTENSALERNSSEENDDKNSKMKKRRRRNLYKLEPNSIKFKQKITTQGQVKGTPNTKINQKVHKSQKQTNSNEALASIALFSCSENEQLPTDPNMPADLFTSCLTTPIKTALRWHICSKFSSNTLPVNIDFGFIVKILGKLNDRKTMLGQLNWIFTTIADTIAWDILPNHLFRKLYRQDIMISSLFRNFLLAERIMKSYNCTPFTIPSIPETYKNDLWNSWDSVIDLCLYRLKFNSNKHFTTSNDPFQFFGCSNISMQLNKHGNQKFEKMQMEQNTFLKEQYLKQQRLVNLKKKQQKKKLKKKKKF